VACQTLTLGQRIQMARQANFQGQGLVTIVAVSQAESGGDTCARNPSGATGILQFMPGTAAGYGLDPTDPQASFDAAYKLSQQGTVFSAWSAYTQGSFQRFVGQVQAALSSAPGGASGPAGGNPVSDAITGALGAVRGSLAGTGQALQSSGQVLVGILVMAAGGAVLGYLLLTRTAAGRGVVRGVKDVALLAVK
jgi:hypothetical protein